MLFETSHSDLIGMIRNLELSIPDNMAIPFSSAHTNSMENWDKFFNSCKEIQEVFNSGVKFPTKEGRQEAWERFNKVRGEGHERRKNFNIYVQNRSSEVRDEIRSMCSGITYSVVQDTIFFFDQTTKAQVKLWQGYLQDAQRAFKEKKHLMTKEHNEELWQLFQKIHDSHQTFWQQHNKAWGERKSELDAKQRNWEAKQQQFRAKVSENLSRNREKLRSAKDALSRAKDKLSENRDKYYSAETDKWRNIFSEWVAQSEEKVRDIEASIERLQTWIDEDEKKLR
jgi:hypothetical protein